VTWRGLTRSAGLWDTKMAMLKGQAGYDGSHAEGYEAGYKKGYDEGFQIGLDV
jgi:flagellar biosynthesis/type III secretory pathway protein FliH